MSGRSAPETIEPVVVSREPWWALPPQSGQDELECKWGYLLRYSDGHFEFDDSERPTDEEIKNRTSCRI